MKKQTNEGRTGRNQIDKRHGEREEEKQMQYMRMLVY